MLLINNPLDIFIHVLILVYCTYTVVVLQSFNMVTLVCLCSLVLLATTVESSAVVEKHPALDATIVYLYQQLLGRVEHLEQRDQDQQAEIDTLRSELYAEKQRTSILEEAITSLRSHGGETSENDERVPVDSLPSNKDRKNLEKRPGEKNENDKDN